MDFPKEHLGHSYGPAPTNSQLGINLPSQLQQEPTEPDDHIVAAVKKLLADGYKGTSLWNILTALRGPDEFEEDMFKKEILKRATTCVIRHYLGLKKWDVGLFISEPDSENSLEVRKTLLLELDHFTNHAKNAFTALGLKWDEVNK